jgi:hypothetical protein
MPANALTRAGLYTRQGYGQTLNVDRGRETMARSVHVIASRMLRV